jgi:hypothetical protein
VCSSTKLQAQLLKRKQRLSTPSFLRSVSVISRFIEFRMQAGKVTRIKSSLNRQSSQNYHKMIVGKTIRVTACAGCRLSLLRTFTSIAVCSIRSQAAARVSCLTPSRAQFSSQSVHHEEVIEDYSPIKQADPVETISQESNEQSAEVPTLPWYLQVKSAQRIAEPLSERQRIPEMPENAPQILQPLLQRLSIDLGLDDLSILDLRKLDPPPALGANLIMLLGTARSEKHLHVSADRLCRWLRSTYKLRPDADGLLGRNEIKLKLRRKSRRARLMGSTTDDNDDDGIRTGWVCVDVGVVEGPVGLTNEVPAPKAFVGFGRRTDGIRIVVQMLTEEKRAEIDLEKLWGGILKRSIQALEPGGLVDESLEPAHLEYTTLASQTETITRLGNGHSPILTQSRAFHTSTRRLMVKPEGQSSMTIPSLPKDTSPNTKLQLNSAKLQELVILALRSDQPEKPINDLLNYTSQLWTDDWAPAVLDILERFLKSLKNNEALVVLGETRPWGSPTSFLTCFYEAVQSLNPQAAGEAKIWLYCCAQKLGHQHYTHDRFMKLFLELQLSGVEISRESYVLLLRALIRMHVEQAQPTHIASKIPNLDTLEEERPYSTPQTPGLDEIEEEQTSTNRLVPAAGALEVLQAMHEQGKNILTEDILVNLQEAASPLTTHEIPPQTKDELPEDDTFELPTLPLTPLQHRIHTLIECVNLPCFEDESRFRLLDLYARQNHFLEFWDIFRMAPRRVFPQSPDMYAFMFSRVAMTGNQRGNIAVLRAWVPELLLKYEAGTPGSENRRSIEPHVAEAVKACLRVADPYVEQDARADTKGNGEWITMWERFTLKPSLRK